ncbi:MAG: hypothetical protein N3A53_01625 [Verrucomicrobiae bacterium]|nr:hypothetical protein [Verrucomicrobiae bacterium]
MPTGSLASVGMDVEALRTSLWFRLSLVTYWAQGYGATSPSFSGWGVLSSNFNGFVVLTARQDVASTFATGPAFWGMPALVHPFVVWTNVPATGLSNCAGAVWIQAGPAQ